MNVLNTDLLKQAEHACGCAPSSVTTMKVKMDPPEGSRADIRAEKAREESKGRSHLILGEKVAQYHDPLTDSYQFRNAQRATL